MSPDAAWLSPKRADTVLEDQQGYWPVCPDFVLEVRSPSDRLSAQQEKLQRWIEYGARLGWLIDPEGEAVWVYREGAEPEQLERPSELSGGEVLAGLVVELDRVWQ